MPYYEVFIPAKPGSGQKNVTLKVEAPTWLLALRSGMHQIGEQGDSLASILCENQPDGTIIIKDPATRRIFRIKEISQEVPPEDLELQRQAEEEARRAREEAERLAKEQERLRRELEEKKKKQQEALEKLRREREEAERKAREEAERRAREEAERKAREEAERRAREEAERRAREEAERRAREEAERKAREEAERKAAEEARLKAASQSAKEAAIIEAETRKLEQELKQHEKKLEEVVEKVADLQEGVAKEVDVSYTDETPEDLQRFAEAEEEDEFDPNEVLAYLFERTIDLMFMDVKEGLDYIMDLAMEVIPCEAGAIILSDYESPLRDLYFAVARGPVAEQVKKMRIPRGKGFVGFSVNKGVALAVSDVQNNPNWYREIAEKTGFPTRSLLCVPINIEGRTFGAIELINKQKSNKWSTGEINIIAFLADKAAELLKRQADQVDISDIK